MQLLFIVEEILASHCSNESYWIEDSLILIILLYMRVPTFKYVNENDVEVLMIIFAISFD